MNKTVLVGLLSGLLGVGAALVARHLWQDHLALHQMADIITRSIEAQQKQAGGKK